MNHHDAEITEVVVVLDGKGDDSVNQAIGRLKELGLQVSDTKSDEGVIEGTIDASRVSDLKTVPGVCYVRSVFSYTADYPPGDPRDKDGPEASFEDDEE
jgi:hypothetical protein